MPEKHPPPAIGKGFGFVDGAGSAVEFNQVRDMLRDSSGRHTLPQLPHGLATMSCQTL